MNRSTPATRSPTSQRRSLSRALQLAALVLPALAAVRPTPGQSAPIQVGRVEAYNYRFAATDNPSRTSALIGERFVSSPGSTFLTLKFSGTHLPNGGYLDVFSPASGETLTIDAQRILDHGGHVPMFRGDMVRVRLYAGPTSRGTTATIANLGFSSSVARQRSLCGATDDRVPSADVRVGRMVMTFGSSLFVGTGFLISSTNCFVTAGHNLRDGSSPNESPPDSVEVQFDVPASDAFGFINPPSQANRYLWSETQANASTGSCGADFGVFRTLPNWLTDDHAGVAQGDYLQISGLPALNATVRVTGYGQDLDDPTRSKTQQTQTGALTAASGYCLSYHVDTMGGNSGSPVIDTSSNTVFGIHTDAGCTVATTSANSGTWMDNPDFVAMCEATCLGESMPAHYSTYGRGCVGRSGTRPWLSNTTRPVLGTALGLAVSDATPNTTGVLTIGLSDLSWAGLPLPLDLGVLGLPGCNILAAIDVSRLIPIDALGSAVTNISIPNRSVLGGVRFFTQVIVLDPATGFDAVSNAGRATIGQ